MHFLQEGFAEVAGGRIWYGIIGKGSGKPLLVVHGGPGYPHEYLEPVADISDERPVIFYDQLGCGNSDRPEDNSLWTLERYTEELASLIKKLDLQEFHILGHSWGAALAVNFALQKPAGLKNLILADPYISTPLWLEDAGRLKQTLPAIVQLVLKTSPGTAEFERTKQEYYDKFVTRLSPLPEAFARTRAKQNTSVYRHMWGPEEFLVTGTLKDLDLSPRLSEISAPTLLLCGRYDEATPEAIEYFKNKLPNARTAVFENSAHHPQWSDRASYIQTLRSFLLNQ